MTQPAISVIMGAYNAEEYVGKAIESILNQTFLDFEFIIIDDGSKDGTGRIIDDYAAKDSRIVAIHHENMGHANSLNKALSLAKAPLIARMDADDIALPHRFEEQVKYLNIHPEVAVLGTSIRLIDNHDNVMHDIIYSSSAQEIAKAVLDNSPLAHPTVIMRKDIVKELGGYRAVFDPAEDYDLWLRISEKHQITNLSEIYLLYRQHSNKLSFKHSQYQTLCTFVLQLASKVRRQGLPDPLASTGKITAETLKLFDLTEEQEVDLLYKTYGYSVYSLVESNDEMGLIELFENIDRAYNAEYAQQIKYRIYVVLFRNYYNKHQYMKAYRYLIKILPSSPLKVIIELIRSLIKQLLPGKLKIILKKFMGRNQ